MLGPERRGDDPRHLRQAAVSHVLGEACERPVRHGVAVQGMTGRADPVLLEGDRGPRRAARRASCAGCSARAWPTSRACRDGRAAAGARRRSGATPACPWADATPLDRRSRAHPATCRNSDRTNGFSSIRMTTCSTSRIVPVTGRAGTARPLEYRGRAADPPMRLRPDPRAAESGDDPSLPGGCLGSSCGQENTRSGSSLPCVGACLDPRRSGLAPGQRRPAAGHSSTTYSDNASG